MIRTIMEERATELVHYIIDSKDNVRGAVKRFTNNWLNILNFYYIIRTIDNY